MNQVTGIGSVSIGHDARGNVNALATSGYIYSSENLMTGAPGGATLSYDPLLRVHQIVGSGTTLRFGLTARK